jgi:hypothetical protein
VTGTLKYKGKPVPNVLVNFVPEAGRPSVGRTDNEGRFTLDYDRTTKGAELGKHKVFVMLPPGGGRTVPGQQDVQTGDVKELLAKYGPDKSKVEVTVDRNTSAIPLDWD